MNPQSTIRDPKWWIVLLALILYLNILPNTFIFDDWQQIFENPYLRDPQGLRKILATNVWGFEGKPDNYYRPLMHLAFYVNLRLFGFNPAGYHALSLLLHALNSLLVYLLVKRITGDWRPAAAAGLLFAAHPIHTENVAWISGYPDLMATLFVLLGFWALGPQASRLLFLGVCLFLGLLAKETAIVLPLMCVFAGWKQRWREYAAMAVALAAYLALRIHALGGLLPYAQRRGLPPAEKLFTTIALFYRYAAKMLWPAELNAFPHYAVSHTWWEPAVLAGAATAALFAFATYQLWRARRPETLGMILFAAALAPAFTLPYGDINLLAERYLYLPSVGLCWVAGWLLFRLQPKIAAGVLAVILAACSVRTVVRNLDWRSEIPFYQKTLRMSPQSAEVHVLLGEAYLRRDMFPQALKATQKAAELKARYPEAHNNLGQIYSRLGAPAKAIEEYSLAARFAMENQYVFAAARTYNNMGFEFRRLGKTDEAMAAYRMAIQLYPEFAGAYNNLGYAELLDGKLEPAEADFERAVQLDPTFAMARANLGLLYFERREFDRAMFELMEASKLEPRSGEIFARLGDVSLARGDTAAAYRLFRRALELHPENERARAGLARLGKN